MHSTPHHSHYTAESSMPAFLSRVRRAGPLVAVALSGALALAACPKKESSSVPEEDWAYARQITNPGDLIGGPVAEGEPGDFLIGNRHVRFIIQGHENPRTLLPFGGSVIDADVVRVAGEPGQDRLQELGTIAGYLRVVKPTSVEVISDGRRGKPAIVRVLGRDAGMPLIDTILPLGTTELGVQIDYVLAPGERSLRIDTTYTSLSAGGGPRSVKPGDALLLADLLTLCTAPEPGCTGDTTKNPSLVGAYAPGLVAYGYFATDTTLRVELQQDDLWLLTAGGYSLAPGETATFTRYLAVAAPDPAALLPEVHRRRGVTSLRQVAGQVTLDGTGVSGDVTHCAVDLFSDGGEWLTRAITDESGAFQAWLSPSQSQSAVILRASQGLRGPESSASGTVTLPAGEADVTDLALSVSRPALVSLDIRDDQDEPLPARVQFHQGHDATPIGRGDHHVYSLDGSGTQELPAGDYTAVVTRGYEYDSETIFLSAVPGETRAISASLSRVVDTTGYLSVDPHSHTRYSIDSQLDERMRVAQAAAEHVELVVTTEHDVIHDLAPTIASMNAQGVVRSIPGIEISPLYGHINAYPVSDVGADRAKAWPVAWWETDESGEVTGPRFPTAIFDDLRQKLGAQIIQLNHPRESQGVLNFADYDPSVGFSGVSADLLSTDFNTIEIQNSGFDSSDAETFEDWMSFLNQGLRTTAVGVSDSHGLSAMLGIARTMVAVEDDVPSANMELQPVLDALLSQRAVVVSGPFVEIWALDDQDIPHGLGAMATRAGAGPLKVRVRIQAAPFVHTARLVIYASGAEVLRMDLPDPGDPPLPLRFDDTLDLDWVGEDLWILALVEGDRPMWPLVGGLPRSVTNPVYIDRDGDGQWTAPGL